MGVSFETCLRRLEDVPLRRLGDVPLRCHWDVQRDVVTTSLQRLVAGWVVIMNKVCWSFGDLKKSSFFPTMNTLDISNTNFVKVKMKRSK